MVESASAADPVLLPTAMAISIWTHLAAEQAALGATITTIEPITAAEDAATVAEAVEAEAVITTITPVAARALGEIRDVIPMGHAVMVINRCLR